MADPEADAAPAAPAASRTRFGAIGAFIISAFTSMSGGVAFPPEPDEIEEGQRQADLEEAARQERRQRLHAAKSLDDLLLRERYGDGAEGNVGHRAMRRLRSSTSLRSLRSASSMNSLRKRFRKGGRADVAGIAEIPELDEEGDDTMRPTPSAVRAVASPTTLLADGGSRGVVSMDSSQLSTVSRSDTGSTRG